MAKKKKQKITKEEDDDLEILGESSIDDDRYDRQSRIIGWNQSKIANATVMIIGVGATGNEVAKNLALTGIGKLILIDYDIIEKSNLNRCVLFTLTGADKNAFKVDVVEEACKKLNPDTEIMSFKDNLDDIDKKLYQESDVVLSCLDNMEARLQANNYTVYYKIPFVDSGIDEFFGSVQAVYSPAGGACLQCGISNKDLDLMFQKFSCTGEEIESADGATVGKMATIITTTSIIGGLQSQQALKFILGIDHFKKNGLWDPNLGAPLIGRQLNYNGITNKFDIIEKLKNPKCWTCSYKKKK